VIWRRVALGAAVAGGLASPATASHGQLVGGVVVEFQALQPVQSVREGAACSVAGAVHNGSGGPVLVRVTYRARDPAARPLIAHVRVDGLAAGERREFTSPPLLRRDGSTAPCQAIRDLTMETAAEPVP
jgi:hypothetical protein